MKKKSIYFCSLLTVALAFASCSENYENVGVDETGDTGEVRFTLSYASDMSAPRAAGSSSIPVTNWSNVNQLQFLLYDAAGIVRYSMIEQPTGNREELQYSYQNIPVGTYTIVAVANAKSGSDPISTYGTGAVNEDLAWTEFNVRSKKAADLLIKHKTGTWPAVVPTGHGLLTTAGKAVFQEPAEIFMGSVTTEVKKGEVARPAAIELKREVSLMRVRMNVNHPDVKDMIEWNDANASIMIYRVPQHINIVSGVSTGSNVNHIQARSGAGTFRTQNPGDITELAGKYSNNDIISGDFTMWRDIMVFPNNGGRANNGAVNGTATADSQYFIVVTGTGKQGHKYANGDDASGKPVVWYGTVTDNFVPNTIREVNLTVQTKGEPTIPVDPKELGDLVIKVGAPEEWSSNIYFSDIKL